jgi:hypothetical protein
LAIETLAASFGNIEMVRKFRSELDRVRARLQDVAREGGRLESSVGDAFARVAGHAVDFAFATKKVVTGIGRVGTAMRGLGVDAGLTGKTIIDAASSFAQFVAKAAAAREELQMFGRVNRTTASDIDKITRGYERLGMTQGQVEATVSGLRKQINNSIAKGKGGTPDWMQAQGISARDGTGEPRDTSAILQDVASNYLQRQQQVRRLQAQEAEAKLRGDSGEEERSRIDRARLQDENIKLATSAEFSDAFLSALMKVNSIGEFTAAFSQGANDRPGMTAVDDSNFEKLNNAITEAQVKLGALGDAMARMAAPVLTSALGGINSFLDKLLAMGKAFGWVNKSEDDAETSRRNNARAYNLRADDRSTPGLSKAINAGASAQQQGFGSFLSGLMPSKMDLLAMAHSNYQAFAEILADAPRLQSIQPGTIERGAVDLKRAAEILVKANEAVNAAGGSAGKNSLQRLGDYLRSLQPQQSGIEMLIKMISAGSLRPDINDNRTMPAVNVYQTVTGATAPGAAGNAVANVLKNHPSSVDFAKTSLTATSGGTAQ